MEQHYVKNRDVNHIHSIKRILDCHGLTRGLPITWLSNQFFNRQL